MPKSTPGPWQVKRYANHELQTDFVMVVIGDGVHMIGYSDEDKANAHLIAAAPQMLEALEMADELIDQLVVDNTDNYAEERAQIRAAIAAAKGEA